MRNIVVETSELTMQFGGVTALSNVNFKLQHNELRCLIGPNGAGKSTFFKCLSGLLTPTTGDIYIKDTQTTGFMPHAIARLGIGIKTQVPNVMNSLTARENIWLAAKRGQSKAHANQVTARVLAQLELSDLATERVEILAHGQRQLIELAIVMAGEPWLVLLDEPAAGLTAQEVERMGNVINKMNENSALIIVEHDMHFVRSVAKFVTVFHQGKVLLEDDVDTVMNDARVRDVYLGKKA